VALSKRGQAHKVDEKWMSRCNQEGVSPVHNKSRINLRTMSAGQLQRLEEKVDERHGWALAERQEELREATRLLEEERYEHVLVLEKEGLRMQLRTQKQKEKLGRTEAGDKHNKLQLRVTAAFWVTVGAWPFG
jgi:hypothetical protein